MKQIQRQFYLQQLIDGKQNGLIKIITGIRRCGKSYLLFKLFTQYLLSSGVQDDHIIRIALDDIESKELRDPLLLYKHIKGRMADEELYYVLLDEVQLVPQFEEVLNSLLRMDNADVYVVMRFICILFRSWSTVKGLDKQPRRHGRTTILMAVCPMSWHLKRRKRRLII